MVNKTRISNEENTELLNNITPHIKENFKEFSISSKLNFPELKLEKIKPIKKIASYSPELLY